jgi:hypothetical protein
MLVNPLPAVSVIVNRTVPLAVNLPTPLTAAHSNSRIFPRVRERPGRNTNRHRIRNGLATERA